MRDCYVHGLGFWLVSLSWIHPTVVSYGGLPGWLAAILLVLLCLYLALFQLAFGTLGRRLWTGGGALALAALPALWVALEWLREHLLSGFPWNLAGYAWVEVPGALPASSWIGIYGVSFLLLLGVAMPIKYLAGEPRGLLGRARPWCALGRLCGRPRPRLACARLAPVGA